MKENSIYDKKSIRTVMGKTADFDELAKDCVAFSNAEGGRIDIGIEDEEKLPPIGQRVPRLLKNAPMLGKENCYKYFRISLKLISFTSNNTL